MDWDHAAEEHKYDDIRMLVHHRSRAHPPMSLWDRAAQFSPFAALSGHEDAIRETARLTTERIELSESRKEELNEQLVWLREHPDARERVTVTYFRPDAKKAGGVYVTVTGAIKKIDEYEKTLWMEDGTVIAIEELSAVEIPGKNRYEEE